MGKKKVVILGAGPAGLTAAHDLLTRDSEHYDVIILEKTNDIGGISKTINYKGNLMDIGGHRFFSKDPRVNEWWQQRLEIQSHPALDDKILNRHKDFPTEGANPDIEDDVFLIRDRISRIYYNKSFLNYPISLDLKLITNIGIFQTIKAGFSYLWSLVKKLPETSLENFYINRFGRVIYSMFFEKYTLKLWGIHPKNLSADWGCQRVKGISVSEVLKNAFAKQFNLGRKSKETSFIERFLYPKFGPGQLWEKTAKEIENLGGKIKKNIDVTNIIFNGSQVREIIFEENDTTSSIQADFLLSSAPIKDLFQLFSGIDIPEDIYNATQELRYRDFITIGFLLKKLNLKNTTEYKTINNITPDCWIYVQEPHVKMGRIQIFNNWSPYSVKDLQNTVWIGTEYFCTEGDEFWNMTDQELFEFAKNELLSMNLITSDSDVLDWHCEKIQKAYPAYVGSYNHMDKITDFLNQHDNLFCIGRNGQHRYNNMDHSMMTAFNAVENIIKGEKNKNNIWNVNTEKAYCEKIS